MIFGLQLPQIKEIAKAIGKDYDLGNLLWADRKVRESRILALLLLPPERISLQDAKVLAADIRTREEADLLPFLLLRFTPHIPELLTSLQSDSDTEMPSQWEDSAPLRRYLIETLSRFLE